MKKPPKSAIIEMAYAGKDRIRVRLNNCIAMIKSNTHSDSTLKWKKYYEWFLS